MSNKPVFLISDLHLGAVPRSTEAEFRAWLHYARNHASHVVINGDLFDFWFEYGRVIPSEHVRVLAALAETVDAGVPVTLMGGNHDWWGGAFYSDRLGVTFHQDPVRLDVFGRTLFLAHGDGLGAGDLGYRLLKLILRGHLTRWAFRWLHPDIGAWIADRVSETERRASAPNDEQHQRSRFLQAWARSKMETDSDLDIIALGHTHIPTVIEVSPGRYYVNSGDWVYHRSFVTIASDGVPKLHDWRTFDATRPPSLDAGVDRQDPSGGRNSSDLTAHQTGPVKEG